MFAVSGVFHFHETETEIPETPNSPLRVFLLACRRSPVRHRRPFPIVFVAPVPRSVSRCHFRCPVNPSPSRGSLLVSQWSNVRRSVPWCRDLVMVPLSCHSRYDPCRFLVQVRYRGFIPIPASFPCPPTVSACSCHTRTALVPAVLAWFGRSFSPLPRAFR